MKLLLAGPIVRRAEPSSVCFWIATSQDVAARAEVFDLAGEAGSLLVGRGEGEGVKLGPRLFVHLIRARPLEGVFAAGRLFGYDIEVEADAGPPLRLRDLGLLDGPDRVVYEGLPLPTFFLAGKGGPLRLLHGSCRMLHGRGEDALAGADAIIARNVRDAGVRPGLLYLTGDQIYGDEVGGPLIGHLTDLGRELMGPGDETSVPDFPPLSEIPCYERQPLVTERANVTSEYAANHLVSFGEFAATYLVAWNRGNWPPSFPAAHLVLGSKGGRLGLRERLSHRKYGIEARDLETTRATLPAVRRALANVPTYMAFDDHDVTDDWNLTAGWRERVWKSPGGRRIVANALAAFWAFQGWGNDPDNYDDTFKKTISGFLSGDDSTPSSTFERALWSFDRWSFHVPTSPPTIFLDTRTQRAYDSEEGAARLIGKEGRAAVLDITKRAGHSRGEPLVLVSPVPIFGLEMHERRQKFLKDRVGPYEIDLEAWHSNLNGLLDFMRFLIDELGLETCLFLSGDVHYGMNLKVHVEMGGRKLLIAQLVSSSQKHSGSLSKSVIDLFGKTIRKSHRRLIWARLPPSVRSSGVKRRLLLRDVNTDDWAEESPLMLSPRRASQLRIDEEPDLRERREYVPMSGAGTSKLIGENNSGLVSVSDGVVVHELLCPTRNDIRVYRAEIEFAEDAP